jgi:2-oxopent-4-enoate/cis-2-oxohex-4-enoate hydratase
MARQLAARADAVAAGAAPRGWKVAFSTPASRRAAGLDGPVVGSLTSATERPSGATIDVSGWTRATIEAELAIHVADDGGIAAVGPAIEVVDVAQPFDAIEDVLAGSIFHRHFMLGAPDPARRGGNASGIDVRALVDGELVADQPDPCSVIGALPDVLGFVAAEVARHGEVVRPGDVILAGSAIPLHPVAAGQRVRMEAGGFEPLEVAFTA